MGNYQDRVDIDWLFDLVWDSKSKEATFVYKEDFNQLLINFQDLVNQFNSSQSNNQSVFSCSNLLGIIQNYNQFSNNKYTLFRGDCWTINNNFESSASITSTADSNFTVNGTFRTDGDLVGIYWNSKDLIEHSYISYGSRTDYTDVILEFDYSMSGCKNWGDDYSVDNSPMVMTLTKTDGSIFYLVMYQFIENNHVRIDFNNLRLQSGNTYINNKGQSVTVTESTKINVKDIESVMFLLRPLGYTGNYSIINNQDFTCSVSNITVTNGDICNEHIQLEPHQYRLCEGYDDIYNFNPRRLAKEMRKLGYTEWVDLYIGASHFYEKSGTVGQVINVSDFNHTRTEKMVLNQNTPLNVAFRSWLNCYSRELKSHDSDKLIISVSMENLQCPTSWRQKTANGDYAVTGWIPSTFFYSPCNSNVVSYMQSVSEACLDIVVANNMQPILQMGEAWWWWNELDTPNQPPCFYDDATRNKYYADFGENIPVYNSSNDDYDSEVTLWLNQQLVGYSDNLRSVVKASKYNNGLYMALFFPPSVLDTDRVPSMMREVNYIIDAYHPAKLDILQLEDYDWVTEESPHHEEVYSLGEILGFPKNRLHYYGGFVQYPEDAIEYWKLIKTAMEDAEDSFDEVYVWAGSQIRRDNQILGYKSYDCIQYIITEIKNQIGENTVDVSFSGDYNDLYNRPSIPTKTSDLFNDSGFLTSHQSLSDYLTATEINQLLSSYALSSALNNYYTKTESDNKYSQVGHTHDERYYTESEVNTLLNNLKNELDNRIILNSDNNSIEANTTVRFTAYILKDGMPMSNQLITFYREDSV